MSEQLSSGNLGFRLTLPETLELQTLTASMNKMAEDLNQVFTGERFETIPFSTK